MRLVRLLPGWVLSGVLVFPVLAILGILVGLVTGGRISYLFWLIIPSIVFEEALEGWWYAASDSMFLNALFALVFWFTIASSVHLLHERVTR